MNLSVSCINTVVSEFSCPMSSGIMRSELMRDLSIYLAILTRVWSQTRHTIWSGVSPPPPPLVRGCTSTIVWIKVFVSLFWKKKCFVYNWFFNNHGKSSIYFNCIITIKIYWRFSVFLWPCCSVNLLRDLWTGEAEPLKSLGCFTRSSVYGVGLEQVNTNLSDQLELSIFKPLWYLYRKHPAYTYFS